VCYVGSQEMLNPQNRYEIIGTLGTGATSRVDRARDSTIGRTVAIKTFLHGFGSGDLQKQFLREAQIIGRLTHPYIVGLYDVGTNEDGVPFLVMEYVDGKTLEKTLDDGPLPLERAAVWAADLASALARAHQCKIIHGDVKPANILITKEGQVKLGDFGIARFATQVSGSGSVLGTPAYLSPEQILGGKQDTRSDLFSLGIILYQMTTGVRPFDGTSVGAVCAQIVSATPPPPSHHNPSLPPAFDHIVMRCLAKEPAQRYADAEALGASLYPFARSKPVTMPLPSPFWWKRPMQIGDLRAAAILLAALTVAGVGYKTVRHFSSATQAQSPSAKQADTSRSIVADRRAVAHTSDLSTSPSASLIYVGTSDVGASGPSGNSDAAPLNGDTTFGDVPSGNTGDTSAGDSSSTPGRRSSVPSASHAFERHAVAAAKPKNSHATSPAEGLNLSAPTSGTTAKSAGTAPASKSSAAAQTSLHVDIVSGTTDEILSIYSGKDLLLTTQLEAAHLGDTLRFECPITPGEHAFRVVLSRTDDTVLVEKANTSQIRADGSNFLGVHVTRRAKMLVKHESSLEVVWPSMAAPIAAAITAPSESGTELR
jgi:serine/threonine protein kinase